MKTIILGIGNPIITDDAIGILVARKLREILKIPNTVIEEASIDGFRFLDLTAGEQGHSRR